MAAAAAGGDGPSAARRFNSTFSSLPTTIFEQMSLLAAKHQSTNLGQGFPDNELEGPESMKKVVSRQARGPRGAVAFQSRMAWSCLCAASWRSIPCAAFFTRREQMMWLMAGSGAPVVVPAAQLPVRTLQPVPAAHGPARAAAGSGGAQRAPRGHPG